MSDVKTFVDTVGKDVTTVAVPRIEALATGINDKVLNTYGPRVSAFANELVKDIINEQSASVRDFVSALIQELAERYRPASFSEHLAWSTHDSAYLNDLLPLPYTEEALNHVAERVMQVQDHLGRRLVLENVSSYVTYAASELTEWEFIAELARRADCEILLDVNNVYVSAFNHEFHPVEFLRGIPRERVRQFHLAGHTNNGTHIIDTHDHPIVPGVWYLYAEAVRLFPGVPTMIERDADIPPYAELLAELDMARGIAARTRKQAA